MNAVQNGVSLTSEGHVHRSESIPYSPQCSADVRHISGVSSAGSHVHYAGAHHLLPATWVPFFDDGKHNSSSACMRLSCLITYDTQ